MEGNVTFRTVIEVLGKPKEHVEQSLKNFVEKLKADEKYEVKREDFAPAKEHTEKDLWAAFVELEVSTVSLEDISKFCFDFMPAVIEVIEPKQVTLQDDELSHFLNALQAKLHTVDMVAKQIKMENDFLKEGMQALAVNYILILLKSKKMTSKELSKLTGIQKDRIEDLLDSLIDKGEIDLEEEHYYIKQKEVA